MSFQEEKRESIKRYMLEKIRGEDGKFIQKTMDNFGISVTTVKRYIKECLQDGILEEVDGQDCGYRLAVVWKEWEYELNGGLSEDRIYYEDVRPFLEYVSKEADLIWSYAFMEMMNNAIEHSGGSRICCRIKKDYLYTEISITDDGIGIFKKVQEFFKTQMNQSMSYQDVVTELYKGKMTTNGESHSGEGIFFSSKMLREFAIWSENTIFSVGCYDKIQFVQSHLIAYYTKLNKIGTMVVMKLENQTKRKPREVFDMFAPIEEGFVKTVIPVKEVCPYGEPIARSQARRVVYRLEEFREVEFDFTDIDFMGQGFADEVFRVFQNRCPEVVLTPVNANESVLGMIQHVRARSGDSPHGGNCPI